MSAYTGPRAINLLDAGAKRELRAARANVTIMTYCVVVVLALVAVGGLTVFSYNWLGTRISNARAQQTADNANTSGYDSVRAQAATFSSNLGKIQSVLQNRSNYSDALLNIAASLPSGASIQSVTLSPAFVTTPLQISATTPDYASALALKTKLSSSPIYSQVTLGSANCDGSNGCSVAITATLKQAVFTPGAAE